MHFKSKGLTLSAHANLQWRYQSDCWTLPSTFLQPKYHQSKVPEVRSNKRWGAFHSVSKQQRIPLPENKFKFHENSWKIDERSDWTLSDKLSFIKGKLSASPNLKDLMEKTQNLKIFWNRSRIDAASSLQDLNRIKTNQNKWKSMTFLIGLH